jgi:transposase InsO family protein
MTVKLRKQSANPDTGTLEGFASFSYFRIIDWGWYALSTVLHNFSRYIIAWRLSRGNVISGNTVGTLFRAMEAPPTPTPTSATAR